jgi:hypothetical protein
MVLFKAGKPVGETLYFECAQAVQELSYEMQCDVNEIVH